MTIPTIDLNQSKFRTPTWEVKVNSVTRTDAVLSSVEKGYGSDVSNGVFVIETDPDAGGLPVYNDVVEIYINSRRVLKGKIKGITDRVNSGGLSKVYTVIANTTKYQQEPLPADTAIVNQRNRANKLVDQKKAQEILNDILGFIPAGTPDEYPGELTMTDQTQLEAAETVIRKLGNYKLYFNEDTELLEIYKFGDGGDFTSKFVISENVIDKSITENRQDVVDQLTLYGPPRAVRVRELVEFTSTEPDENGVHRVFFELTNKDNVREIEVLGSQRGEPSWEPQTNLQVLPEDMGISPTFSSIPGFAEWPFFPLAKPDYGGTRGDIGFRPALKTIIPSPSELSPVGTSVQYLSDDSAKVFISNVPQIWFYETFTAAVDNNKIGVTGDGQTTVSVLTRLEWFRGALFVEYTRDGDRPSIVVGSGTVKRSITDSQYQIFLNEIPGQEFSNETDVLTLMQKRADAEFARLNRPKITGSITIVGDELIDLKSTVIVSGQKLDVVKVIHSFDGGFTTQIALTNEPFVPAFISQVASAEDGRSRSEQLARTDFRIDFGEVEVDQNIASQKRLEFQKRIEQAGLKWVAAYQD